MPAVVDAPGEGDELTVAVAAAGRIPTHHHGDGALVAGESGHLALRPEHLLLTADGDGALAGTVADRIFLGSSTHYLVDTETGVRVRVAGADDAAARGDRVGIAIAPGRGVFVRQERSFDDAEALPDGRPLVKAEA